MSEDNWRVRWMTGYYYKVINQNNRRVTIGLNNMIWHYDKDLSGYSLGRGGYYSPQEYLSFAIPVMLAGAHGKLVVGAGGVWLVVAFTHQNHAALSADESDPDRLAEEAARQSNDGGSSQGLRLHGAGIT
ncbi:cellulose synthase subunit BcsC-related outer membrane protein [Escherichia coli]